MSCIIFSVSYVNFSIRRKFILNFCPVDTVRIWHEKSTRGYDFFVIQIFYLTKSHMIVEFPVGESSDFRTTCILFWLYFIDDKSLTSMLH